MNCATHVFKLTSGIECEVKEMTGATEDILTRQDKRTMTEKLDDVLIDTVVRIGDVSPITKDTLKQLLSSDRKLILTTMRQFTLNFQPTFSTVYKYKSMDGTSKEEVITVELAEDGTFPVKPMMVYKDVAVDPDDDSKGMKEVLVPAEFETLDQLKDHTTQLLLLPRSKQWVAVEMLDRVSEEMGAATKETSRSTLDTLRVRRVSYFFTEKGPLSEADAKDRKRAMELTNNGAGGKGMTRVSADLKKMSTVDLAFIRDHMKEVEGDVDTLVIADHPEAKYKMIEADKEIRIDVVSTTAFFFLTDRI